MISFQLCQASAYFNQYVWNVFKTEKDTNPRNKPYVLHSQRTNKRGSYVERQIRHS